MALAAGVEVLGLKELIRDLKKLNPAVEKQFKAELKDIATDVLHDAQGSMPVRSARALEAMKAGANSKGAYVQGGKKSVPYYGWLDFGSRTPIRGRPRSVGPWTGSGKGPARGRILYPAIDRNKDRIMKGARGAVEDAINKVF